MGRNSIGMERKGMKVKSGKGRKYKGTEMKRMGKIE